MANAVFSKRTRVVDMGMRLTLLGDAVQLMSVDSSLLGVMSSTKETRRPGYEGEQEIQFAASPSDRISV